MNKKTVNVDRSSRPRGGEILVCYSKGEELSGKRNLHTVGWCHVEGGLTHVMRWSDLSKTRSRESNRGKRWTGNSLLPMVLEGSSLAESRSWTSRWHIFCETESDIKHDGLGAHAGGAIAGDPYLGAIRLA